jgi:hypothetical protein
MSEKHPQSAMLIQEMVRSLSGGETVKLARAIAICTLNMLLTKHDFDARYQEPGQRARVALVYFPLVPLLLDAYGDMEPWHKESPPIEKRGLYVSLLFVLRNVDRAFLRRWWRLESVERRHRFLDLLAACAATFEYDRANAKGAILQAPSFAFATSEKKAPESPRKSSLGDSDADKSQEPGKEGKLNCFVTMLLLDVVEDFVEDFAPEMATPDGTPTLERVLALLVNLLERPQSLRFLESLFASLRAFLSRFRSRLFSENSSVLYALCREVLRYANTASAHTRALATSLLFLLMLRNYEEMGQFGRIYTQATTALSQLITEGAMSDDTYIRHAFNSLTEYALFVYSTATIAIIPAERARNEARHCYLKAGFARQVQELSGTLTKILRDTIEVTELKQKADSEMMAELYFRIAQGYVHTPDLRVTWLNELARFHYSETNFTEAALCHIHICALVLEYLKQNCDYRLSVREDELFHRMCPGLAEIADQEEEGACQSDVFSEAGLLAELNLALDHLEKAGAFEYAIELYGLQMAIYQRNRSYKELAACHKQLNRLYTLISAVDDTVRLENEFFRVGFYGRAFGRLDGKQFIYKEPKFTHLFDFTEKVRHTFTAHTHHAPHTLTARHTRHTRDRSSDEAALSEDVRSVGPADRDDRLHARGEGPERQEALPADHLPQAPPDRRGAAEPRDPVRAQHQPHHLPVSGALHQGRVGQGPRHGRGRPVEEEDAAHRRGPVPPHSQAPARQELHIGTIARAPTLRVSWSGLTDV